MSGARGGDKRIKTATGETYIPATQRPDGTWRKPLKVKEGYIPADERPRYQCRAQRDAQANLDKPKFPVGWSPKELQQKAQKVIDERKKKEEANKVVAAVESKNIPVTAQDHIQKKINNLRKKLNDIQQIQSRIDSGELKNPEKTQLQKMQRKTEIQAEMDKLTTEMSSLSTTS